MVSGFFAGGLADSLQQQQQNKIQQQYLGLQQQIFQNEQQRQQKADLEKQRAEWWNFVDTFTAQGILAGHSAKEIMQPLTGILQQIRQNYTAAHEDPGIVDIRMAAAVSQAVQQQQQQPSPAPQAPQASGPSPEPSSGTPAPPRSMNLTDTMPVQTGVSVENLKPGAPLPTGRQAAQPTTGDDDVNRLSRALAVIPKDNPLHEVIKMRLQEAMRIQSQRPEIKQFTNPDGTTSLKAVDPRTGKVTELVDESMGGKEQAQLHQAFQNDLHGKEFLSAVPAERRNLVKGIAKYEINPMTTSIRGGERERVLSWVKQFDPSYDQTVFSSKQRAEQVQGQRLGILEGAIQVTDASIPRVLEAAKRVPYRTNYPPINQLLQMTNEQLGDPNIVAFKVAVLTTVNAYARAIGGTSAVLTDSARREAEDILQKAWSNGQIGSALSQMRIELQSERQGAQQAIKALPAMFGEENASTKQDDPLGLFK